MGYINHLGIPYYRSLHSVAAEVLHILSEVIEVNTIFLAGNDQRRNYIIRVFNRQETLLEEGKVYPFNDILCNLLIGRHEPLVIPDLKEETLTKDGIVTHNTGTGCFLGIPIYMEDGTMFGTLCAFDTKAYHFQPLDIQLIQTLGLLITKTLTLEHNTFHDSLTGLYNRNFIRGCLEYIENSLGGLSAVLYIDLDRFQVINDTFGHTVGDEVLIEIADRLVRSVPEHTIVARIGGDEYAVLISHSSKERITNECKRIAENILTNISSSPVKVGEDKWFLTASIGISYYPKDGQDMGTLLTKANSTMYIAKANGKNNIQSYEQKIDNDRHRQYNLEAALRNAIANEELAVVYQPQLDLSNEQLVGFEALLRWHNPTFGVISPVEFIPIAEESGLIQEIGYWVLRQVCEQGIIWRKQGLPPIYLSVNLSPRQFEDLYLTEEIAAIIQDTGYDPNWLKVEITESLLLKNVTYTLETMQKLKKMGICIAIDDFGQGYSSLQYLAQFPIDCLKLDRFFIMNLERAEHKMVATAIINLAHSLRVLAIAEGIEDEAQLQFLQEQNCAWGQGFYYSKPLPVKDAEQFYRKHLPVLF